MTKKNHKKKSGFNSGMLQYADPRLEQRYATVEKELGDKRFICKTLNSAELVCKLTPGTAKKAKKNGITRLTTKSDRQYWVVVQPMSSDIDGKQEIVTVYNHNQSKQLKKEGKLAIVKEESTEETSCFDYKKNVNINAEKEINDDVIDIDDL